MAARIACFGSLNHDLAVFLPRFLRPDETLHASRMAEGRGGKGANQATAAARLGAQVAMVGAVGDDERGASMLRGLAGEGIDVGAVTTLPGTPTGVAIPLVTDAGEVSVIVVAGANGAVGPELAEAHAGVLGASDVVLLQGELPAAAAGRAAELARAAGARVLFNPAPVVDAVVDAVAPHADVVVMNADEAAQLGDRLQAPLVVTTLGARGVRCGEVHVPAFPVEVVDPTGAGDAFCGALAVALAEGRGTEDALRFASATAGLAVTRVGAGEAMPSRAEVEALLA